MQLIDDWRTVLKRAWSLRLIALAAILSGLEAALALFGTSLPGPAWLKFLVVTGITIGAFVARLLAQRSGRRSE